jgi:cell division septum initiation protein DivIVA
VQELQERLEAAEMEKASLHETLLQAEALIKQARVEHQVELQRASSRADEALAAARSQLEHAQAQVHPVPCTVPTLCSTPVNNLCSLYA